MKADRVILGEDEKCICSMDTEKTQLNNNLIVCGSSGSGKTMSVTEMKLLETKNSSLIVTLSKRRLIAKYKPLFESRGYRVLDLNFISPKDSNVSYDPLHYIKSYLDVNFLAESIVKSDPQKQKSNADPYWDQCAISLLSAEIGYVIITKKNATFNDVLNINATLRIDDDNGIIKTSMDDKFANLPETNLSYFTLSCWRTFRQLPIRTAGCVYSTLNTILDTIFGVDLRKMINIRNKLDFASIANEKTILFVSTSPVNPSLQYFIATFYTQAFKSLFEYAESREDLDYKLPLETHIICDDFAVGARVNNFAEFISIFREKKISVTLLIQSESQLEAMYGESNATTIRNNCDTYLFLGSNDLKTAKNISEKLNVPLDEVLYIPLGKAVLFRRGHKPIITKRYNIKNNELYKEVTKKYNNSIARIER